MIYILDTVAIIRHFTNSGKIGSKAKMILDSFNNSSIELAISVVSLMEIMYLSEKKSY